MERSSVGKWADELSELVARFTKSFEVRFGFPPDDHAVVRAQHPRTPDELVGLGLREGQRDLICFYSVIEEVSLPDVGNGLFIHRVAYPVEVGRPTILTGEVDDRITVFGSDGGGSLFALGAAEDVVYRLQAGSLFGDTYEADAGQYAVIASSLDGFLELVLDESLQALS